MFEVSSDNINILYSCKDFIVCEKPSKIPCESANKEAKTMVSLLEEKLSTEDKKESVYLVHRLDQVTSGLMVFALNKESAKRLSESFQSKEAVKEYLAIIHGELSESHGEMRDLLYRDAKKNKSFVVKRERKGVKEAILEYYTIKTVNSEYGKLSLVRIKLHTGRTHQIRVQFASRGLYLLGDGKYGAKDNCKDVALLSCKLVFPNPKTKEQMEFNLEPKDEFPWDLF